MIDNSPKTLSEILISGLSKSLSLYGLESSDSNIDQLWIRLTKSGHLQSAVDISIEELISLNKLTYRKLEVGMILKSDIDPITQRNLEYVIVSVTEVIPDIYSQWEARELTVCPNPVCKLQGQFFYEEVDKKLNYYCPACFITWRIRTEEDNKEII
jgi:hypothetical protein